jgi:hypothetical protein
MLKYNILRLKPNQRAEEPNKEEEVVSSGEYISTNTV